MTLPDRGLSFWLQSTYSQVQKSAWKTLKNRILSSLTHPYLIPNLYDFLSLVQHKKCVCLWICLLSLYIYGYFQQISVFSQQETRIDFSDNSKLNCLIRDGVIQDGEDNLEMTLKVIYKSFVRCWSRQISLHKFFKALIVQM